MITKINLASPARTNYINHKSVSFKAYNTMSDDIDIFSKKIESPIRSMSGDINIEASEIKGDISSMSGDIDIASSSINGDINNLSGKIRISEKSMINGNIDNKSGKITLNKSTINGNTSNASGKIILKNSILNGTVTSAPENIELQGENQIKELVLSGFKKATAEDVDKVKADSAKQGIFIGKIGHINNTRGTIVTTFVNNKIVSSKIVPSDAPYEFRLPKGNIINKIKFDADEKGVLILEKGAEFCGKIINGIIKRA